MEIITHQRIDSSFRFLKPESRSSQAIVTEKVVVGTFEVLHTMEACLEKIEKAVSKLGLSRNVALHFLFTNGNNSPSRKAVVLWLDTNQHYKSPQKRDLSRFEDQFYLVEGEFDTTETSRRVVPPSKHARTFDRVRDERTVYAQLHKGYLINAYWLSSFDDLSERYWDLNYTPFEDAVHHCVMRRFDELATLRVDLFRHQQQTECAGVCVMAVILLGTIIWIALYSPQNATSS